MGSSFMNLPLTYVAILIGSLAITGFPFLTGFYSKDILLEAIYSRYTIDSIFIYQLSILVAFFTAFYSVRLLVNVFFRCTNSYVNVFYSYLNECSLSMFISLFILIVSSIFFGYLFNEILLCYGNMHTLSNDLSHSNLIDDLVYEYISPIIKNLPFIIGVIGFCTGHYVSLMPNSIIIDYGIYNKIRIFEHMFYSGVYFNNIYNKIFAYVYVIIYNVFVKSIDKGMLEYLGPIGFYRSTKLLNSYFKQFSPSIISFNMGLFSISTFYLIIFYINSSNDFIPILLIILCCELFYSNISKIKNCLLTYKY